MQWIYKELIEEPRVNRATKKTKERGGRNTPNKERIEDRKQEKKTKNKEGESQEASKKGRKRLTQTTGLFGGRGQQGKPRGVENPTIITIEVDEVVVDFDGFFKLSFEIVVLIENNLHILQTYVMFGRKRMFG